MRIIYFIAFALLAVSGVWLARSLRDVPPDLRATLLNVVNKEGQIAVAEIGPVRVRVRVENVDDIAHGPFHVSGVCDCEIERPLPAAIEPGSYAELTFRAVPQAAGITIGQVVISDTGGTRLVVPFSIVNESPIPRVESAPPILVSMVRGESVVQECQFTCIEKSIDEPFIAAADVLGCDDLKTLSATIIAIDDREILGATEYVRRIYTLRLESDGIQQLSCVASELALLSMRGDQVFLTPLTGILQDPLLVLPGSVNLSAIGERKRIQILHRGSVELGAVEFTVQMSPETAGLILTPDADFVADGGPVVAQYVLERTLESPQGEIEVVFQASDDVTARLLVQTNRE
jgi:hypothetical protein